jgi:hypothetical protein
MAGANNFQVSSKLPDGRIFVVGSDTFAEFKSHLTDVLGPEGVEKVLGIMASSLEGVPTFEQAVTTVTAGLGATPVASTPPQTFTPSTAPSGRSCKHGPMTKRSGSSAKGPWKGYMCPTPKGTPDQCDPVFLKRNEAEWSTF